MSNTQKYLRNFKTISYEANRSNTLDQYRYYLKLLELLEKAKEELEARKVAEPSKPEFKKPELSEGERVAESSATKHKKELVENEEQPKQQPKKIQSATKKRSVSWPEQMNKFNSYVPADDAGYHLFWNFRDNFMPSTATTYPPYKLPESRYQQKKAAQEEVNRNVADIDLEIDTLRQQRRQVEDLYAQSGSLGDKTIYSNYQDEVSKIDTAINEKLAKRREVEMQIKNQLDPDYVAASIFESFESPLLAEKDSKFKTALENFGQIKNEFANGGATKEQLTYAANTAYEAKRDLDDFQQKLASLNNYIKNIGMPDSFVAIPKIFQDTLKQIAPNIDADPEYFKQFKDYVREYSAKSRKERALQANDVARNSKPYALNEDLIRDLESRVLSMKEISELLSGANAIENQNLSYTGGNTLSQAIMRRSEAYNTALLFDSDYKNYEQLQRILTKAKDYRELGKKVKATNEFWTGDVTNLKDWKNWGNVRNMGYAVKQWAQDTFDDPLGLKDLSSSLNLLDLANKIKSGEALTSGEKMYMDALAFNQAIHDKYSDIEDVNAFKYGKIAAESMRFMAEFMVGNSILSLISKAGTKQVGKAVSRNIAARVADFVSGTTGKTMMQKAAYQGMESLGREGISSTMMKYAHKVPGFLTLAAGDAVNALLLEGTILLPRTIKDVADLRSGIVDYTTDENGNVHADKFKGGLGLAESIYTGVTRDWIENFSEQMGEWGIGHLLGRPFAAAGSTIGRKIPALGELATNLSKYGSRVKDIFGNKAFYQAMKAGEFHGVFGETAEEYYGMALQHLFGVSDSDKNFWDDITSKDNFFDIFGGIALSTAFLGTIGVGTHLHTKHKYDSAKRDAQRHFGDKWDKIELTIVMANQNSLPAVMRSLTGVYNSKDDVDQLLRYYDALERYRGSSYAAQSQYEDLQKPIRERLLQKSRETGYTANSMLFREDVDRAISLAENELENVFGTDDIDGLKNEIDGFGGISNFINAQDLTNNEKIALYAYDSLVEMRNGALQRLTDDYNDGIERTIRGINRLSFKTPNGNRIINVQFEDGDGRVRDGYVIGGDFSYTETEDGTEDEEGNKRISYSHTANGNITVRDSHGNIHIVSSDKIKNVNTAADSKLFTLASLLQYTYDYKQQEEDLNNSVQTQRGIKFGETYQLINGDQLTTVSAAKDGGILYTIKSKETGEETMHYADSQQSMNQIIEDALGDRANMLLDKVHLMIINEQKADELDPIDVEATAEVEHVVNEELLARAEEAIKAPTSYIENNQIDSSLSKNKAKKRLPKIRQIIEKAKSADSFELFKLILRDSGINVRDRYDVRLRALYNAFKNGNISVSQLAIVFIPENLRAAVLPKSQLDKFNQLEIDSDGNVQSARQAKADVAETVQSEEPPTNSEEPPSEEPPTGEPPVDEDDTEFGSEVDISVSPEYTKEYQLEDADLTPAPVATPAGAVEANNTNNRTPQQNALDALNDKIVADRLKVKREYTSSFHYFIEENGVLYLHRRVHSILDDQYEPKIGEVEKIQQEKQRLLDLWNNNKEEFEKILRENNLDGYLAYVNQNNADVDIEEACEGIASHIHQREVTSSMTGGNIIDSIQRKLFGNIMVQYEDYKDVMSKETFNSIVRQTINMQKLFKQWGWRVVTVPVVFYSKLYDSTINKEIRIAGETDMVAVDKHGNYIILDFKTSKRSFNKDNFDNVPTFKLDGYRSAKRSTREQYSRQQTMYSLMLLDNLNGNVSKIFIVSWTIRYDSSGSNAYINGAVNEVSGAPCLIELLAHQGVINRFTRPDDSEIYERLELLISQSDFIQQRVNIVNELFTQASELVDSEIQALLATFNQQVDAYNQLLDNASKTLTGIEEAIDSGKELLSTSALILDSFIRKSQEYSNLQLARANARVAKITQPVVSDDSNEEEWKQKTTTHKTSFGGFLGIEDAVALDNKNMKLSTVTGNPDFITNAKFAFIMQNGRVHVQITYNGHTYQPVSVSTGHNDQGRTFYNTVKRMFRSLPSGKLIVSTGAISRTRGRIKTSNTGTLESKGLVTTDKNIPGTYLYDVQFAAGNVTFGMILEENGQFVVTIPGRTAKSRDVVFRYDETAQGNPANGGIVMMVRRQYDELPVDRQPLVPINMNQSKMTQGDVDLIVGILSGDYCRDKSVNRAGILALAFYEDGVNKGLTNEQVLNMLIAYGSYNRKSRPHVHIEIDQTNGNIIHVVGNVVGDPSDQIADRRFDFSTAEGKEQFKLFLLQNVKRNIDRTLMMVRLNDIQSKENLLFGLKQFMTSSAGKKLISEKGAVRFGNSSIIFDEKDFKDPNNPDDQLGLSGLGWYIRHGYLETDFAGFENTLIEFDHSAPLQIVDAQQQLVTQEEQVEQQIEEAIETGIDEFDPFSAIDDNVPDDNAFGLRLQTLREKDADSSIDIESAKNELRRMLGDEFDIKVFDGLIKRFENGLVAVGACLRDAIWLSKMAKTGTTYHEAFHRVVEVVFNLKQRERAYRIYRNTKKLKDASDHQVGEAMADDFAYFVENRPTFKASWRIFKAIADYIRGINKVGGFRLFWLYRNVYKGKYANRKPSTSAALKAGEVRWLLVKRGQSFEEIATQHQYKVLLNSLAACLLNPSIRYDGGNIPNIKIDKESILKSPIFKLYVRSASPETKAALRELINNWDAVQPDLATYISQFATDFNVKYEDENDASREGSSSEEPVVDNNEDVTDDDFFEEIASASNEEHMKASYEFSLFSRTSLKVKFFFSGIIKTQWVKNSRGEIEKTYLLNEYGLPQMFDPREVFAEVLSACHDCTSIADFKCRLAHYAQLNPMFDTVLNNFNELYNNAYGGSEVNYDAELVIAQIFSTIRAQKHNFEIVKSTTTGYGQQLHVFHSDAGHSARAYCEDWSNQFAAGANIYVKLDDNGNLVMRDGRKPSIFIAYADRIYGKSGMAVVYSTEGRMNFGDPKTPKFIVDGVQINPNDFAHVEITKRVIVKALRTMGIVFEKDVLDHMLMHKYGSVGADAVEAFLQDRSESRFYSFCNFVKGFLLNGALNVSLSKDGQLSLNGKNINKIFNDNGFVKELANWKYNYRTSHDMLSVLATNNKKYYVIAQNNLMSDRLLELENGGTERDNLFSTPYVLWYPQEGAEPIGSIVAKHVLRRNHTPLSMATFAGFRTDTRDDYGSDYEQINSREDYISKMTILLHGVKDPTTGTISTPIIFPTLADKKTWNYIYGVSLPGIDFSNLMRNGVIGENGAIEPFTDEVVDQFIEYAITEDRSIRSVLDSYAQLSDELKVDNFHKGLKVTDSTGATFLVIQGGRFSGLLGVYNAKGEFVEFNRTLDENGIYQSEEDCYRIAHLNFFDPQLISDNGVLRYETTEEVIQRQRSQIRQILRERLAEELEYAEELGLIERINNDPNPMLRYRNVGLDGMLTLQVEQLLKGGKEHLIEDNVRFHSMAVSLLIADCMSKHMMSMQEVERLFSGNPQAFKFKYDSEGHLYDRTVDLQKRVGGLVSTGQNNVLLPGMPEEYTAAEVDNEMIQSEDLGHFEEIIYRGLLRQYAIRYYLQRKRYNFDNIDQYDEDGEISHNGDIQDIELKSVEELESLLPDQALAIVKQIAKEKTDAFRKDPSLHLDGVDVNDGAAYITDKMAENLLRMAGSFDNDVAKAFKILRGEEVDGKKYTVADINEIADAYRLVLTSVIGALKYTAYGFRYQYATINGQPQIVSSIPYYDKMALFPMFKNICTGKMANIFRKMQDDGVDMLMIKSAVKTGSEGSKEINWDSLTDFNDPNGFHFHTYKQKYAYLRKQFNTDPKEKEIMSMGTLMTKVCLSTLIPGRVYNVNGQLFTGTQLRDKIMTALNSLSDEGVREVMDMFFTDGVFDIERFSRTITDELSSRGASAEMLDAVSVVERNGKKELKIPLAALSGMNWIQSIIKSMVDKRVVDTNTPGKAFYQRSVWAMEGETHVLGDTDLPKSLNNGNRLLTKNEEGSMDCVLSIDYFSDVLNRAKVKTGRKVLKKVKRTRKEPTVYTDKYGRKTTDYSKLQDVQYEETIEVDEEVSVSTLSFEKQKQWLIDHGIISGMKDGVWQNAKASIIGYRIPTQAISSIHSLRVVDVLPVVRDTIILPAEFTKITGADFDIDKVFLSTLFRDENGDTDFKKDPQKLFANTLLQCYLAILNDTDRSFAELNGSIDNDTELIKSIVSDIFGKKVTTVKPYQSYTMYSQFSTKDEFMTGKKGIGPFALNNNNHVLTMLYGVRFAKNASSIMTRLGLESLAESLDADGKAILSWISGYINAHVDVAKDPYISRLNVNAYTYNLVCLLARTGFGKKTLYFTSQPIMKQLAEAYANANGKYMSDQTKSKTRAILDAEDNVLFNLLKAANPSAQYNTFREALDHFSHKFDYKTNQLIDAVLQDDEILRDIAKRLVKDIAIDDKTYTVIIDREVTLTTADVLVLVALANRQFKPYCEALSELVQYTKIDTKKEGKNIVELTKYMDGYRGLSLDLNGSESRKLFDTVSLDRMLKGSYIETKTRNAIEVFKSILGQLLIESTDAFDIQLTLLMLLCPRMSMGNVKDLKALTNQLMAKIKSNFFFGPNGYAQRIGIDVNGLITGNNTIYDRLLRIKAQLATSKEYSDMVDGDGNPLNYMLRNLVNGSRYDLNLPQGAAIGTLQDTYAKAKFLRSISFANDETIDADEFSQAWEDLLKDTAHPELQEFARDLIVYAFITSGDNGGRYDIFKFVPGSWKLGLEELGLDYASSYVKFMQDALSDYMAGRSTMTADDFEDIILNNWHDNRFVPTVRMIDENKQRVFESWYSSPQGGYPLILGGISLNGEVYSESYPYIKMRRYHSGNRVDGQREYTVYKRIGYGVRAIPNGVDKETNEQKYIHRRYPIYIAVDPRGSKFESYETILGYGQQPVQESVMAVNNALGSLKAIINNMGGNIDAIDPESIILQIADWASLYNGGPKVVLDVLLNLNAINSSLKQFLVDMATPKVPIKTDNEPTVVNYYSGNVVPSPNTIFVFGSNTEGRHGKGAAKVAADYFGAQYGVSEGITGQAYALPTKDLAKGVRSLTKEQIVLNIKRMYDTARANPALNFKIAYRNGVDEVTLNGYSGREMIEMFKEAGPIPSNVWFSQEWVNTGLFNTEYAQAEQPVSKPSVERKTEMYGVLIDPNLILNYQQWLLNNPSGIVAYRVNRSNFNTKDAVNKGIIGNPFDWQKYGVDESLKMFYNWLIHGTTFGEPLATEDFRQAIILRILNSSESTPILYYKELGKPSHATLIGYLIRNKLLLEQKPSNAADNTYAVPRKREYNFGRLDISKSERPYISEKIQILDAKGNVLNADASSLDNVLLTIFNDKTLISESITMSYAEYKRLLETKMTIDPSDNSINQFEFFVTHYLIPYMVENNWVESEPKYNKNTKLITIGKTLYNVILVLINNPQALNQLNQIVGGESQSIHGAESDMAEALFSGGLYEIYDNELDDGMTTPKYSYVDSRQLEFDFNTEDLSNDDGYPLNDAFIQRIKDHIANDEFSVTRYGSKQIRDSLIKMTDALFQYLKDNNVDVKFIRANKNNKAGGKSMIYPNENGDGYIIEVDSASKDIYLDIIHELLHITTIPFDNQVAYETGGVEFPEQLYIYYQAFVKKAMSLPGYGQAYNALWDFKNKVITRSQFEERVPEDLRSILHAMEGPGEFISMFISSEHIQNVVGSIKHADTNLFEELIRYIKDFLTKLFKGYDYIDAGNVIDDVTDFLINYKSSYQTPALIYEPISGKEILSSGETIYTTKDILTPLIPSTALMRYNLSKDLLKSIIEDFNKSNTLEHLQKTAYGSVDGTTKLILHRKNRWVVLGVRQEKYYIDGHSVTGVEYARNVLSKWLIENQLPANFIIVTDGGLVAINYKYIANNNSKLYRGSDIIYDLDLENLNVFYNDKLRSAIDEFCLRLGFEIVEDRDKDTFINFVNKVITISDFNEGEFNKIKARVATVLMPSDLKSKIHKSALKHGRNTDDDIANDIQDALSSNKKQIYESKSLLQKIKDFISDLIGKIINSRLYYEKLIQKAADQISDVYSKWYTTVIKEGFQLKTLDIEKFKQSPMYKAYEVLTDLGASLDGSAAVRMQGTLYRAEEEDFHDLDFTKEYDDLSWAISEELYLFFENYKMATNDFRNLDRVVYKDLRQYMLENCNEIFKTSELYKKLSEHYSEVKIKHASRSKELGLLVTITVDGNPIDIFYAKNVTSYIIGGIKVTDFSSAFSAKLVMGRDKDIRDIINFHKFNIDKTVIKKGRKYKVYQGRTSAAIDGRPYNYWTLHEREAYRYGSHVRSKTIDTTGYLNKFKRDENGNLDWSEEYEKLKSEFEKTLNKGEFFDILNNSERGMEIQNEFWKFAESKGYKGFVSFPQDDWYIGLSNDDQEDPYIVEFGVFSQTKDQLKSAGAELMDKCKG